MSISWAKTGRSEKLRLRPSTQTFPPYSRGHSKTKVLDHEEEKIPLPLPQTVKLNQTNTVDSYDAFAILD